MYETEHTRTNGHDVVDDADDDYDDDDELWLLWVTELYNIFLLGLHTKTILLIKYESPVFFLSKCPVPVKW